MRHVRPPPGFGQEGGEPRYEGTGILPAVVAGLVLGAATVIFVAQNTKTVALHFLWLDFPEGTDSAELLTRATAEGVTFVDGDEFFPGRAGGRSSARLAYSFASPDEIATGIERLASLLREALPVAVSA